MQWSFDELASEEKRTVWDKSQAMKESTDEIPEPLQLALHVIHTIFDLPPLDREILLNRLSGRQTMKEHAESLNITCQAAYSRLRKMRKTHKWIAELICFRRYSMENRGEEEQ